MSAKIRVTKRLTVSPLSFMFCLLACFFRPLGYVWYGTIWATTPSLTTALRTDLHTNVGAYCSAVELVKSGVRLPTPYTHWPLITPAYGVHIRDILCKFLTWATARLVVPNIFSIYSPTMYSISHLLFQLRLLLFGTNLSLAGMYVCA
jgi:hypothetical protein